MRLVGQRLFFLAAAAGTALVFACATEQVSIPSPAEILPDGSVDFDTGAIEPDATVEDTGPACPPVVPDDRIGVYVADGAGANDAQCGTREKPCKTITFGITRAQAAAKARVFVSQGVYPEHVVMKSGITIEGGFTIADTTWTRVCDAINEVTIIRTPANAKSTIEAVDLGGSAAGLVNLHVQGKLQAAVAKGESIYGIVASGATTTLLLENVLVTTANGGDGADGANGATGAPGAAGGCPDGTGVAGTAGAAGTGAIAGTFDQTGWVASAGTDGVGGTAGNNGTPGGAGTCAACVTCGDFPGCVPAAGVPACGTNGVAGCGGGAGGGGGAGKGGGSSIGLFVWDATVQMTSGRIKVGDGGNGGNSGTAGAGAGGVVGKAGTGSAMCTTACAAGAAVCMETKGAGVGGTAGSIGGAGGAGGLGGGGSGGAAVAIYQGGAGVVATTGTNLAVGKGGKGGGTGPTAGAAGISAARIP